jgi:hypothetical protein
MIFIVINYYLDKQSMGEKDELDIISNGRGVFISDRKNLHLDLLTTVHGLSK